MIFQGKEYGYLLGIKQKLSVMMKFVKSLRPFCFLVYTEGLFSSSTLTDPIPINCEIALIPPVFYGIRRKSIRFLESKCLQLKTHLLFP